MTFSSRLKTLRHWFCAALIVAMLFIAASQLCFAQTGSATLSGTITDKSGALVAGAGVEVMNQDTGTSVHTRTNGAGVYSVPGLKPGLYKVSVEKEGFKRVAVRDITLNVQDVVSRNFMLDVGAISETVEVTGASLNINTSDASVSTVVDQAYIKNMPLNGRSLQDLILLTPGVVTQSSQSGANFNAGAGLTGEFSVNGQRTESNNYTVDGVSANVGASPDGVNMFTGAASSGSLPAATALGTTQALVSVDDLQEFRVQSSTYSAEYGRNPGGQFAFETKSGTNQWHGTAYDYVRNDFFDANDWFNNYLLVKEPALRQNDFGGTLGGPLRIPHLYDGKDKTFFFVSYEGLRLMQPRPAKVSGVPDLCLRGVTAQCTPGGPVTPAPAALQPVLNAFPLPNGTDYPDGWAQLKASWSDPSSLDSTSVRFDHVVSEKTRLFFRFSDTTSSAANRGGVGAFFTPSMNGTHPFTTRTYTGGASSLLTGHLSNEFRLNYTSNVAKGKGVIDAFGGSTPTNLAQLAGQQPATSVEFFDCYGNEGFCTGFFQGLSSGAQRQWNFVDTVSYSLGRHQLKFGVDYRRLTPFAVPQTPFILFGDFSQSSVETNSLDFAETSVEAPAYPLYRNFSAFAEDEWRVSQRLSLSMGLRWEVNPAPGVTKGLMPYTVQGSGPDTWAVAPQGTPLWKTAWYNFAPRLGAAYVIRDQQAWETVVRAGGGLFFDSGQQLGSIGFNGPGFAAANFGGGTPFPQAPPLPAIADPTTPAGIPYGTTPYGFPSHFQSPYTLQWNASAEQTLGKSQALTLSYVGSHAGRLIRYDQIPTPNNPNYNLAFVFIDNGLTSDYHSAQAQFRRRLSQGLTALASYTWSHCLDYGSQNIAFGYQRGNCEFDIRHNFSGAFSYDVPNLGHNSLLNALLHHWGVDDRFTARSGFPITLDGNIYTDPLTGKQVHAGLNLNPNVPLYIYGGNCTAVLNNGLQCPGGRAINPGAFANAQPGQAGNAPRNFVRGFGAWQLDMAVRREFPIYERLKLQFRAEAFNIFNHPIFGTIDPGCGGSAGGPCTSPTFGQATATLANSLGILSPLYQLGGARSLQFSLKIVF